MATFVKKLKHVPNTARNCPVARNWRPSKPSAQLSIWLNFASFDNELKLVQKPYETVLLLEIGVKTLQATAVWLEIGDFC